MSNALTKSERRKEQNRRAQANQRKKQQRRIECLEQEIQSLKAQAQAISSSHLCQPVEHAGLNSLNNELFSAPSTAHSGLNNIHTDTIDIDFALGNNLFVANPCADFPTIFPPTSKSSHQSTTWTASPHSASEHDNATRVIQQCPLIASEPLCCAFDAIATNANMLGITPESLISTHSVSSFYCPLKSVASIIASIMHLPSTFHPTTAQLSYPHQPWIDCIPLQDLRSRIIYAVSHHPPLLDGLDLWHDVLADGLYSGPDPQNATGWGFSEEFAKRWQMLLTLDLTTLEAMCLKSNPPVRIVILSSS